MVHTLFHFGTNTQLRIPFLKWKKQKQQEEQHNTYYHFTKVMFNDASKGTTGVRLTQRRPG